MVLPWELEDWLTDCGDVVVRKKTEQGIDALGPEERCMYEVWLFDMETRNGGVSQYFCNQRPERWRALLAVGAHPGMPSLMRFAKRVDEIVAGAKEPYEAVLRFHRELDQLYEDYQGKIVAELRALVDEAARQQARRPRRQSG